MAFFMLADEIAMGNIGTIKGGRNIFPVRSRFRAANNQ
jgi:hypothetical protein